VIGGDHSAPENPDGRLSRLIGSGETGGGPSTPEIRVVGRRRSLSKLIGSGETGGGPSTPEIRIVGWRTALSKLIGSGETGGGSSTPEIRIVGWRTALSKLIGSGETGGGPSTPDRRLADGAKQADRIRGDRRRSLYSGNPDRRLSDGAKQADRIRGDRRRSLHSGNPDRRLADELRGLPAAIISSVRRAGGAFPFSRFLTAVPARAPNIVTFTGGSDVTGFDAVRVGRGMPRAPVPFCGCGGTPHGRGSFCGVRGSAVKARKRGSKTNRCRNKGAFIHTMYKKGV
jgi:hypothetical protein